jgi:uncharacterized protein YndB with AHSA1/START domain
MDKPKFVYVTYIRATPEKVWEALTSGEFTRKYFAGCTLKSDWKVGSTLALVQDNGDQEWCGSVLKYDRPKTLQYTFDVKGGCLKKHLEAGAKAEVPSRVTFELEAQEGGVKLSLLHDDFPADSKVIHGISNGWPRILANMKSLLETGEALFHDWR